MLRELVALGRKGISEAANIRGRKGSIIIK